MLLLDLECILAIPEEEAWHRQGLEQAVLEVCGLSVSLGSRLGHTDYTLLLKAFGDLDLDQLLNEESYGLITDRAREIYRDLAAKDLSGYLRPAAASVLRRLGAEDWIRVVPLSGTSWQIVETLLERAGIERDVEAGFASCCHWGLTRPDLIDRARQRAGGQGLPWPAEETIVLSPWGADLLAARSSGVVAVSFGPGQQALGADYKISNLDELEAALRRIVDRTSGSDAEDFFDIAWG